MSPAELPSGSANFVNSADSDTCSASTISPESEASFDFEGHAEAAVRDYRAVIGQYEDFSSALERLLRDVANQADPLVLIHKLESRAKTVESFRRKAAKASADNPNEPKYSNPLRQITDLAGVRIITFFLESVDAFEQLIQEQLTVIEKTDKSSLLAREERLGYHSIHYIVTLNGDRLQLPEYSRFKGLRAEIQVRTILQHAWAEIEHDVQYKAQQALPTRIRRRFMTLAGLLEIADREFQEIQVEDIRIRRSAMAAVESGNLTSVEITSDALKAYLDRKYQPDGRMTDSAYSYTVRLLRDLGFQDLDQVDAAVTGYDDDEISRLLTNARQGQLTRFDFVLLASLGSLFIERHPIAQRDRDFRTAREADLARMQEHGVLVGKGVQIVMPNPG